MSPTFPLGVDILEWKKAAFFFRSHKDRLKEIFLPHEIAFIRSLDKTDRPRAFAMIYSAKEAAFKTLGVPFLGIHGFRRIGIFPENGFSVRWMGPWKRLSYPRPLKVSFKKTRRHVVATCHDRTIACAGN